MCEIRLAVMSTEEGKEKYDATLKELLANRQFLARILKRFVWEFAEYPLEEIEEQYIEPGSVLVSKVGVARNQMRVEGISNEDTSMGEGTVWYDIVFRAAYPGEDGVRIGMYINVEAQNDPYPGYPLEMRAIYYAARRLSAQLKTINRNTNYGCLQKVYSIWICMNVPAYQANTASLYHFRKRDILGHIKRDPNGYDLLNVVILRFNDNAEIQDEVLGMLQVLCSGKITREAKLERLKQYGVRVDDKIEKGVTEMGGFAEALVREAMAEGEARGEARGEVRGEARGEAKAKHKMSLNMLRDGISVETVAHYADTSVEIVRSWSQELQKN